MAPHATAAPNAEQDAYWNEQAGPKWVALHEQIDTQIRPLGELIMTRAGLAAGERVLDVGCGCGDTTLALARRVAPGGSVLGLDISAPMLARAGQRLESEDRDAAVGGQVSFQRADAQTWAFDTDAFDVLFSRFGVMFFADPRAAFANLHRALRPGGRLAFVCWQGVADNPWMLVPMAAALQHLPPPPLPDPGAPGPFAFADPQHVRAILGAAGFTAVGLEPVRMTLTVGGGRDLDQSVEFLLQMGPTARALRDAPDSSVVPRVAAAVRDALLPYATPAGVRMDSASWLVTARA
jgi:SAM-dependent methyltransferase